MYPPQGVVAGVDISDADRVAAGSTLVNEGSATAGEVAASIALEADNAYLAKEVDAYPQVAAAASIFEHANLTAAKAASIFDDAGVPLSKAASIFDHANLSVAKVYSILAHANLSADRTQGILYGMSFVAKLVDILLSGAGDLTVSSNTEISGVNRYGTLTVNEGITLTITGQPGALIVDTLNNSGTILKSLTGGAAGTAQFGSGAGGQGAGGLIIFADSLVSSDLISADGERGVNGDGASANSTGGAGGSGAFRRVSTDTPGTGGKGGGDAELGGDGGVNGGGGGDCTGISDRGGNGGSSTLTTRTYGELEEEIRRASIDWVIVNVLGKAPTSTVSVPDIKGSGGGGGGSNGVSSSSGGGGGGGGAILTLSLSLNNTGTFRADAGDGGNEGYRGSEDCAGGGGGGGIVYALYKSLVSAGTLLASLGVKGEDGDKPQYLTDGTAGFATSQAI